MWLTDYVTAERVDLDIWDGDMFKIKLRHFLLLSLFIILFFVTSVDLKSANALIKTVTKHIDEIVLVGLYIYLVLHLNEVIRKKRKIFLLALGFNVLGIISSIIFHYQSFFVASVDIIFVVNKFLVSYLASFVYFSRHSFDNSFQIKLQSVARWISSIFFIIGIHDLFFSPLFPKGDYRFFTNSLQLVFTHPTYLATAVITLMVILSIEGKKNLVFLIIDTVIVILTFRTKAIAFCAVFWLSFLYLNVKSKRKLGFSIFIMAGAAAIVGWDQLIKYYFSGRYSPRSIMLIDAIKLSFKHFPLGTGYGSFGTTIAAQYYSSLYEKLGYMNNYGMSIEKTSYLTDSFWPAVIAQNGIIGFVFFICLIVVLIQNTNIKNRFNTYSNSAFLIIIYYIILSIAESSFYNPTALLSFSLLGFFEVCERRTNEHTIYNPGLD